MQFLIFGLTAILSYILVSLSKITTFLTMLLHVRSTIYTICWLFEHCYNDCTRTIELTEHKILQAQPGTELSIVSTIYQFVQ